MATTALTGNPIPVQAHMRWILEWVLRVGKGPVPEPPSGPENLDPASFQPPTPEGGRRRKGISPNMRLIYAACWYAWAYLAGSKNLSVHRKRASNLMAREESCHGQAEPFTPSHSQIWEAAIALILWAAEREGDAGLIVAARGWFRVEYHFWRACWHPSGAWTAGGRVYLGKGGQRAATGLNPARTLCMKGLRDGKWKKRPDQYNVGAGLLQIVSEESRKAIVEPFPEDAPYPPVFGGVTVQRWLNGDFLMEFGPGLNGKDDIRAAGVLNGEPWIDPAGVGEDRRAFYDNKEIPAISITAPVGFPAGAKED